MDIMELIDAMKANVQVEAIALGGSRAAKVCDEKSDYDVYVYLNETLSEQKRKEILKQYCFVMEIGNHYWELEDNCTLKNGVDIDIIYRDLKEFEAGISATVDQGNAGTGYTTCMWHNLITSKILFDRNGSLTELQKRYQVPYPKELKNNIIRKNMSLLSGVLPSYDLQIKKAMKRGDKVSINHRVTEFLASYFDVLFALNEKTHPGEKRLIKICKEQCEILPDKFEENLECLFEKMFQEDITPVIEDIVNEIRKLA